jgi:hypothetical protein
MKPLVAGTGASSGIEAQLLNWDVGKYQQSLDQRTP